MEAASGTIMQLAAILDATDVGRQIAALEEVNSALYTQHGHGGLKLGEVIPVLVKAFSTTHSLEVVLLACRGLNTAIDINPRACDLILPVVPTLCEKLADMHDIDIAEQCVKCLNLLAAEHPRFVFEAGGLLASVRFFDFFPLHLQHTALSTCLLLCEGVGKLEDMENILQVVPMLSQCLSREDDECARKACLCFCRVIENFTRAGGGKMPMSRVADERASSVPTKSDRSGDAAAAPVDEKLAKLSFFAKLANQGLVNLWLKILTEGSPRWTPSSQAQILTCMALLMEHCPQLLPAFFEHKGVELLKRLLLDYVDPLKNAEAGGTASPNYISAILRLASAILPSADAALPDAGSAKKAHTRPAKKERGSSSSSGKGKGSSSSDVPSTPTSEAVSIESAGSGSPNSGSWTCSSCTYINTNPALTSCEMCRTNNPNRSPSVRSPKAMDVDVDSLGPRSVLEVYMDNPACYETYAQDLLIPLFRLALQSSVPGISKLVFSILASLRRHHVESLSNACMASNVSAIIFQNLITADPKDTAQAVDFGASLMELLPEHYRESMLRHGILKEVARLHQSHARGPSQDAQQKQRRPSSKARVGDDSASKAISAACTRFLSATGVKDAASSGKESDEPATGKRKKRAEDEAPAWTPEGVELESAVLKKLRGLAATIRGIARTDESLSRPSLGSKGGDKRQRDGRGRAVPCTSSAEYAVLLEPFKTLAQLLTSAEGVTVFEMTESGITEALLAYLFGVVEATAGRSGDERASGAGSQRDRMIDLYAFASAFSLAAPAPEDAMEVDEAASRPAILALVDVLQATLNAMDALPSTRHGGEGLANRYRSLIRPFKFRIKDSTALRAGASSQPGVQYSCTFVAEPLTTVGHVRQFIQNQVRSLLRRRAQEEAQRPASSKSGSSSSKGEEESARGEDRGAGPSAAASASGASSSLAPTSAALLKRSGRRLEVDTGVGADGKRPTLRRSPRVEKAQAGKESGPSPLASPSSASDSRAASRRSSPTTVVEDGSVSSRTRSHANPTTGAVEPEGPSDAPAMPGSESSLKSRQSHRPLKREAVTSPVGSEASGVTSRSARSSARGSSQSESGGSSGRKVGGVVKSEEPKGKALLKSLAAIEQPEPAEADLGKSSSYGLRSKKVEGPEPAGLGDRIFAAFMVRGQRVWYSGEVTAVSVNDELDVLFEDGEQRYNMSRAVVMSSPPPDAVLYKHIKKELSKLPPLPRQPPGRQQQTGRSGGRSSSSSSSTASGAKSTTSSSSRRRSGQGSSASSRKREERKQRPPMDDDSSSDDDEAGREQAGPSSATSSVAGAASSAATGARSASAGAGPSTLEMLNLLQGGTQALRAAAGSDKVEERLEALRSIVQGTAPPTADARSGSSSAAGAARPASDYRRPPSYQRPLGSTFPTAILRRRFRGMEPVIEEPAGLILAQLHAANGGISGGLLNGEMSMIEDGMRLDDDEYSLIRRKVNLEGVTKSLCQAPASAASAAPRKPQRTAGSSASAAASAAVGIDGLPVTITGLRLCLHDASVELDNLPSGMTTLEVMQALLWARDKQCPEASRPMHRGMSVDDRSWPESVIVEFQLAEAGAELRGAKTEAKPAAEQAGPSNKPDAMQTDAAEPGSKPGSLVLATGSRPLDAAVLGRGDGTAALQTDKMAAADDKKKWREVDIESPALRDILQLLRLLMLVGRDMERSSRTVNGSPVEQEFQSRIKTVDWTKVTAACTVKSLSRKFAAQFQDPVGIVSESWPDWCDTVAMDFSELLPFDVRLKYFQSTAFSRARVMHKIQEQARRLQASNRESTGSNAGQSFLPPGLRSGLNNLSIADYTVRFGNLRRRKMVLPRDNLLEAAVEAFKKAAEGATANAGQAAQARGAAEAEAEVEGEMMAVAQDAEDDEEDDDDEDREEEEGQGGSAGRRTRARTEGSAQGGTTAASSAERSSRPTGEGVVEPAEQQAAEAEGSEDESVADEHGQGEDDEEDDEYTGEPGLPRVEGSFREALLVVDFEGETGHGTGPTQEFYSIVCREVMRAGLGLWREDSGAAQSMDDESGKKYLQVGPGGLFPSVPEPSSSIRGSSSSTSHTNKKRIDVFRFLGRFIGKALQDERLLDLPLSPVLCKMLVGQPLTLHDVAHVDPALGRSLMEMQRMVSANAGAQGRSKLREYVDSLHLDFTLPGAHWYELKLGGSEEAVTVDKIQEYLELVTRHLLVDSVKECVEALKAGIDDVFPATALRCFCPDELQQLLCGGHEEDWRAETIGRSLVCKHGYTRSSQQIQHLVHIMAGFSADQRKKFLMFITGTPRLPIGGFSALSPNLTVVRKDVSAGLPDEYLPSCSTCQVYLKLPAYSSEHIMRQKLLQAMTLGQEHFALD